LSTLFLLCYFFNIIFQTLLIAKIEQPAIDSFLDGRSFGDISLAIRILDKFFWLGLTVHFFSQRKHIFDKKAEDVGEDEEEDDE